MEVDRSAPHQPPQAVSEEDPVPNRPESAYYQMLSSGPESSNVIPPAEEKNEGPINPDAIPPLVAPDDAATEKTTQKDEGPKYLDIAFGMDCTASMGSYIREAQKNIRQIAEEIVASEHADVRLALVEYRDHPPQDSSFVTRVHDFTGSVRKMKEWLDDCHACGGGDGPEAVADGMHQILKLSWREEATKICVFISDAPPHGLDPSGDGFPNGCPDGLDPMQIGNQLAERGVTMYMVGCEPSIRPYRDFFMAIAHLTGGQYVPLKKASLLTKVIVGGAQEEISLQELMEKVNEELQKEAQSHDGDLDEEMLTKRLHQRISSSGYKSKHLAQKKGGHLPEASEKARNMSCMDNMDDIRKTFAPAKDPDRSYRKSRKCRSMVDADLSFSVPPSCAMEAPPPAGGGIFSTLKNMVFGAPAAAPPRAKAAPPRRSVARRASSSDEMDDDENEFVLLEEEISEAQTSRLVQKGFAMNKLQSRVKRK